LAEPLLAENGVLIAMKGDRAEGEIEESGKVVTSGGFTIVSVLRYTLPYNMGERVLTFIKRSKPS
jgi:16S rRNA G527 N7-methylase RsmG